MLAVHWSGEVGWPPGWERVTFWQLVRMRYSPYKLQVWARWSPASANHSEDDALDSIACPFQLRLTSKVIDHDAFDGGLYLQTSYELALRIASFSDATTCSLRLCSTRAIGPREQEVVSFEDVSPILLPVM